ncbi:double zinc ribbon and ankyrin repeat-containing protein 1 [Pseudoliparis swirei]|uniref:double zinc ribbon and ankyrin repeat-containing protein 1 n=1 Tax=Pseudoliparis swirei TaxID=2059687 RepID=UPI0024BE4250|nr:double zinc ribbon and ankyrin repeat-containing protein 1 [Pseudoliparis swirei]
MPPPEGALSSAGSSLRPSDPSMLGNAFPPPAPRFLSRRLGAAPQPPPGGDAQRSPSTRAAAAQRSSTARILRHTHFLRCAECLSARPADPFSGFCAQCGSSLAPLPEHTLPPAEGGQTCLFCEASIHQQLQPQSSLTLQVHTGVCCGSRNPAHVSTCLTCERRVQPRGHAASCVVCWRCGANGPPDAFYCPTCGTFLEAPPPPNITRPASAPMSTDATPPSGAAPSTKLAPPTAEQSTQTVGLYYPSATELQRQETQRKLQRSKQQETRDYQPLLTAVSPGRGFWRKQLDHLCAHLRSYAQNNAPFRTLLGEPRLGRVRKTRLFKVTMVSAVVQEDCYEVSVTVSFVSAGREEHQVDPTGDSGRPAGRTETLSSVTERSADSLLRSGSPKLNPTPKPPVRDVQLLKELGPGLGEINVIQQLLDQGADPSCCSSTGQHALAVAVVSSHHDILPVLVQRGADVNQQSGRMKNTALHEAAALGSEGLKGAQVLLGCGAGVRRRNGGGQTAYDVAVNCGCNAMVSLLAAQAGLDLLGGLGRPKGTLDAL